MSASAENDDHRRDLRCPRPGATSMLKLIYLAKRKPGFTFDDFVRRWRMHGARGMEGSFWRHALGYVQAEPIRPAPMAGASDEFDAVGCLVLRDDAFAAMSEEDVSGARTMAEDELETFAAPIPTTALWVEEERLREGELGGMTAYLFFANDAGARQVAERALAAGGLNRIVLNGRHDDGPLGPGANTLPYQAVVELSASDVPTLAKAVGPEREGVLAESDLAMVTREAVLWNRLVR
jgi:hypothetical protein